MGELGNQPPTGAAIVEPPKTGAATTVRARTQEKPGTGTSDPKPEKVAGDRPTGEITYPDGYKMGRGEEGNWYLEDPSGTRAQWSDMAQDWVDPATGARQSSAWGKQYWPGGTGE